jgi:DNA-binding GntR family transcriptional regulator
VASEKTNRNSSHTAERVAAEIRIAIRHRQLLPGEHVRQSQWEDRLGVSSAPTREALKILVAEQLLSYEPHRGYFVTRLDDHEMFQIYRLRHVLEREVLQSIRWPDETELKALRILVEELAGYLSRGDRHGAIERSRSVFFSVFDLSPLELIVYEAKRYWDRSSGYRALVIGTSDDLAAERTLLRYADLIHYLETQDRDGLIAFNEKRRSDALEQLPQF